MNLETITFAMSKNINMDLNQLFEDSVALLCNMVKTPSISGNEADVANVIRTFLSDQGFAYEAMMNNTLCQNLYWDDSKPVILLNSHVDTVKVVDGWTADPFGGIIEGDRLIGLGSNDAGAPLVSLLAAFRYFYSRRDLPFNLLFAATCEEEISGKNGVAALADRFKNVAFAIVGEPSQMKLAIAEKGLVVFDCEAKGKAGHAARNEGVNAIYKALDDVKKIIDCKLERVSPLLGAVKMTVTQINAGFQHNVVPDTCKFVIDVRTNECYSNAEVVAYLDQLLESEIKPRSLRLNSSGIEMDHPFVKKAQSMGIECFGSPTLSDQSLMHCKSVKIGPGDSARSHTANEYIYLSEIKSGIETYIKLLEGLEL